MMPEPDPEYLKAAYETLTLIQHLLEYQNQTKTLDKFPDSLSQIERKADIECKAGVSVNLSRSLDIDLPDMNTNNYPSAFWQGVRDMARIIHKHWIQGEQDLPTFQSYLVKMGETLRNKIPDVETNPLKDFFDMEDKDDKDPSAPTPFPFVYNPPPPPTGKVIAQQKPKVSPVKQTDSPDDYFPREKMSKEVRQPLAKLILEKDEDDDAMLSKSLKDALRILRDQD